MAGWRDQKASALAGIHQTFQVPSVYWTHAQGTPYLMNVRVHTRHTFEEQEFTFAKSAVFNDMSERLVFQRTQMDTHAITSILPDSFVFVSATEVYRTHTSRPERDGYIRIDVSDANKNEIDQLLSTLDLTDLDEVWTGILS